MATPQIDFSDIRMILCVQGYNLEYQYVVREIGFSCLNGISGSIPFNVKLNHNHLDVHNQRIVTQCEEQINGLKLKRNFENALAASDIRPVLRTLFHLNSHCGKYIAVLRDEPLYGILHKSGIGNNVVYLDNLNILRNSNISLPTIENFRQYLKKNPDTYTICPIHDRLLINDNPICAKVKAEYFADYCKSLIKLQQTTPVHHVQSLPNEIPKKTLHSLLSDFDLNNF